MPENDDDQKIKNVRLPLFFSISVTAASWMIILYIILQILKCCG